MLERICHLKSSCIFLALLSTWIVQYDLVDSRKFEKCPTRDGRQGVCVAKRYCREASSNPNTLVNCGNNEEDIFCCPVPSPRSAVFHPQIPPTQTKTTTTTTTKTTTTTTTEMPSRYPNRNDEDERGNRHRQRSTDDSRRIYYAEDDDVRYNPRPQTPLRTQDPGNRHQEQPSRYDERFGGEGARSRPRDYEIPRERNQNPTRPYSGYDQNHEQPKRYTTPTQTPIKFPGSYETSRARPTVPACGVKPYNLLIAGGEESRENEWPWMTAIFRRHLGSKPNTFLCGGSLINTRYVLTAGHCAVYNYVRLPASSFVVRLGSHFLVSGEDYTVSTVVVHHNYSGADYFNDIALLRLASEVYITDKIAPICLPFDSMLHETFVGRKATVSGWGDTSFRVSGTRILQHVAVPVVSNEECAAAYSRVKGAAFLARGTDHVICAGLQEGGKDACEGDSGGPLMLKEDEDRWVLVGIVSLGYKCAEAGYPGVYTRVTHYMTWIHANMKK